MSSNRSVDPATLAGDPFALAGEQARQNAQQNLLQAADAALDWLSARRAHYPPEQLDPREARHRKALREAIRRVREA